jgi:phosphatidylglycerol---prolipoprotein diacylglyceryl transferase
VLQTLFFIPHRIGPLPVFGWGWLLVAWLLVTPVVLWLSWRQSRSVQGIVEGSFFWLVVGAAIVFLLPNLEAVDARGNTLGLPIRGYGMMMLLGVVSGLGLAVQRAQRMNLNPDLVFALAFRMFVAGIIGARLFFVIEYWPAFRRATVAETLWEILRFTEGGLVVYGSVLGALLAGGWYIRRQKLPLFAVADLISPSLVVGLAFGRIGCLLNGCCFGGICEAPLPSLQFPMGSPPYVHQLQEGKLLGMTLVRDEDSRRLVVEQVDPEGPAAQRDIHVGDRFTALVLPPPPFLADSEAARSEGQDKVTLMPADDRAPIRWNLADLPQRSRAVHPTQVYSAVNALLLLAVLWCYYPLRCWDGAVFAVLMTLYPISRFLIEQIRTDEPGRLGTDLTIAQWVSIAVLLATLGLWAYLYRRSPSVTHDFGRPAIHGE